MGTESRVHRTLSTKQYFCTVHNRTDKRTQKNALPFLCPTPTVAWRTSKPQQGRENCHTRTLIRVWSNWRVCAPQNLLRHAIRNLTHRRLWMFYRLVLDVLEYMGDVKRAKWKWKWKSTLRTGASFSARPSPGGGGKNKQNEMKWEIKEGWKDEEEGVGREELNEDDREWKDKEKEEETEKEKEKERKGKKQGKEWLLFWCCWL